MSEAIEKTRKRGGVYAGGLVVCMGEGCQSCVVERDSTALLHP
jgi:hypothetical protein